MEGSISLIANRIGATVGEAHKRIQQELHSKANSKANYLLLSFVFFGPGPRFIQKKRPFLKEHTLVFLASSMQNHAESWEPYNKKHSRPEMCEI